MADIKIDRVAPHCYSSPQPAVKQAVEQPKQESVAVTNHLGELINVASAGENRVDESVRMADIKQKINSNQYHVDINLLADKLLKSGVLYP